MKSSVLPPILCSCFSPCLEQHPISSYTSTIPPLVNLLSCPTKWRAQIKVSWYNIEGACFKAELRSAVHRNYSLCRNPTSISTDASMAFLRTPGLHWCPLLEMILEVQSSAFLHRTHNYLHFHPVWYLQDFLHIWIWKFSNVISANVTSLSFSLFFPSGASARYILTSLSHCPCLLSCHAPHPDFFQLFWLVRVISSNLSSNSFILSFSASNTTMDILI